MDVSGVLPQRDQQTSPAVNLERTRISSADSSYSREPIQQQPYQLEAAAIDVPQMLAAARVKLEGRIGEFVERTFRSSLWSMARDAASLQQISEPEKVFEKITGTLRLSLAPQDIRQPALRDFFTEPDHTFFRSEHYETRGAAYYVARNKEFTPHGRLDSMERDITAVHKVLSNVQRDQLNPDEFLYFLGALDYLKSHAFSLYQVLTHSERKGQQSFDNEYVFNKGLCLDFGKSAVRAYYQHLLGHGVGHTQELDWYSSSSAQIFEYLRSEFRQDLNEPGRFKLQECDHPIVIGLNAHENALRFPDVEVIISLPLGGLQPAHVTQFAYSLIYHREPTIVTAPLSMHSGKEVNCEHVSREFLVSLLKAGVVGKSVLVTEDNSNTGSTLRMITEALKEAGAREVHVALAELDLTRIQLKQSTIPPSPVMANLEHHDFETAVRSVPIQEKTSADGTIGLQMVKLYADRVIRISNSRRQ